MELRQVVTGTLAWTGLVVVVAVPTAEALLSHLMEVPSVPHVRPVDSALATTVAVIAPKSGAAPSAAEPTVTRASVRGSAGASAPIIEQDAGHPARPVSTAAATEVAPGGVDTSSVIAPEVVANVSTGASAVPDSTAAASPPAMEIPSHRAAPAKGSAADLPTIGETRVTPEAVSEPESGEAPKSQAAGGGLTDGVVASPPPLPMSAAERPAAPPPRVVTAEELKDWKSGSLADYLRQQKFADSDNSAADSQN